MKQYRNPARLLALLLALTLAFSLTALPAAAEGSGRPTFSGEVYAGINNEGGPTFTVWDTSAGELFTLEQPGDSHPSENPVITYKWDEINQVITAAVNADIEAQSAGISADAELGSITVTAGNITVTGEEGTGVSAAGNARITAGTITADGEYSYGMRVFDGADVTADSVSAAGESATGVWAYGSGATVSVQKDIKADRGIEFGLQSGAEFGITVGGDVTAKNHGLYVIPDEGQTYDPGKPGRADVLIGGTLSGQNPIVLGDEIGNDSLNLTVWKIQSGEGGFSGTMRRLPEEGTDEYKLVQDTSGFDRTIRYIIRVQQPDVEGATLSVTDKDGKTLDPVQTTEGTVLGEGAATEGQTVYLVVSTGFNITTAYNNGEKILQDDAGNWYIEIPKGGGVVLSADVEKKTFTISFFNDEEGKELLQTSTVEYGEMPVYNKDKYGEPTRAATAEYTFTWDGGWEPAIVPATEEAVYKATFKSVTNSYDIHFVSDDGSELEKQLVAYGTTPAYSKGTPEKSPDAQYTYSFSKWDKDIVPVKGEATYKAVFTGTLRKYDVTFNPGDGKLVAPDGASSGGNYEYGTEITLPNATREDGAPFQGWSDGQNQYKAGDKISVEGALTLTAMWGDPPEPEPDPPKPVPPFAGGEEPPAPQTAVSEATQTVTPAKAENAAKISEESEAVKAAGVTSGTAKIISLKDMTAAQKAEANKAISAVVKEGPLPTDVFAVYTENGATVAVKLDANVVVYLYYPDGKLVKLHAKDLFVRDDGTYEIPVEGYCFIVTAVEA